MGIDLVDNLKTVSVPLSPSEEFRTHLIDATIDWWKSQPHCKEEWKKSQEYKEWGGNYMQQLYQQLCSWKKRGPMQVSVLVKNNQDHFAPDPSVPTFDGLSEVHCSQGMAGLVHFLLNWKYDAAISYGQCIDILNWIDQISPFLISDVTKPSKEHLLEIRKVFDVAVTNKGYVTCG